MRRYRDLTPRQTEVLCEVATGNALPPCRREVLDVLSAKGMIVRLPDLVMGHDRLGAITIPQYEMPVHEHIAWCEWASGAFPLPQEAQ